MQSPALDLILANPRITGLNLFTKWISLSIILIRDEFKWLKMHNLNIFLSRNIWTLRTESFEKAFESFSKA